MSEPRLVDPGEVVMTGENSFVRLSIDDGKTLVDRVSHWRVLWFIDSPLTGEGPRVYSDNIGMARYLQRRIETLLHAPFGDESLSVIDAEFTRTGNSLATVEERISSDDGEIVLAWWDLLPAFVITVPPGQMNRPIGVYSTFFPARGAQLSVNGEASAARPFPQDRSGKASSSCVLAWSETWVGAA